MRTNRSSQVNHNRVIQAMVIVFGTGAPGRVMAPPRPDPRISAPLPDRATQACRTSCGDVRRSPIVLLSFYVTINASRLLLCFALNAQVPLLRYQQRRTTKTLCACVPTYIHNVTPEYRIGTTMETQSDAQVTTPDHLVN